MGISGIRKWVSNLLMSNKRARCLILHHLEGGPLTCLELEDRLGIGIGRIRKEALILDKVGLIYMREIEIDSIYFTHLHLK
jgi:hypothetical protein